MTTVKSPTYARSPPPQRLNIDRCINKKQKFTRTTSASRYYSFKSRNSKKFSTPKNSPFPLTQSIKVHRRALVLLPRLRKYLRCENSASESRHSHYFWSCNVTTYKREPTTRAWNIWRQDGAICSKNRKIVPYLGSARTPRLAVSVPDYGS